MARYIDADLLWKALDVAHLFDEGNPRHIAQQVVEEQPTADVVEVVRCGKCIWYNEEKFICTNPHCTKSFYGCRVDENHYCSYGERKCEDGKQ